jgi:hypothetical protein
VVSHLKTSIPSFVMYQCIQFQIYIYIHVFITLLHILKLYFENQRKTLAFCLIIGTISNDWNGRRKKNSPEIFFQCRTGHVDKNNEKYRIYLGVKPLIHQSELGTYTKVVPFQEKSSFHFVVLWKLLNGMD